MKAVINHMILHNGALATEFDDILGLRVILAGVVMAAP